MLIKIMQWKYSWIFLFYWIQKVVKVDEEENPKLILNEMKSLYDFKCPAICKLYDAFYIEGKIHFILEYMNGGSLESIMKYYGSIEEPILSKMSYWVK